MKVLVIAAHPDDEVLGVGGTIAKHVESKDEVYVCILGEGITSRELSLKKKSQKEKNHKIKKLKNNALEASKILGIKKILFFGLPDQKFDTLPILDIIKKIEKCVKEIKPDIVYTHSETDLNRDHRIVFEASMVATRPLGNGIKKILSYEVPSSTEWGSPVSKKHFIPNVFINIEKTLEKKLKAMKKYKSEIRDFPHPRSTEALKALAKKHGVEVGLKSAEAFVLIREINPNR